MRANLQLANEAQWKRLARRCWKPVKHVPEQSQGHIPGETEQATDLQFQMPTLKPNETPNSSPTNRDDVFKPA